MSNQIIESFCCSSIEDLTAAIQNKADKHNLYVESINMIPYSTLLSCIVVFKKLYPNSHFPPVKETQSLVN